MYPNLIFMQQKNLKLVDFAKVTGPFSFSSSFQLTISTKFDQSFNSNLEVFSQAALTVELATKQTAFLYKTKTLGGPSVALKIRLKKHRYNEFVALLIFLRKLRVLKSPLLIPTNFLSFQYDELVFFKANPSSLEMRLFPFHITFSNLDSKNFLGLSLLF